MTAPADPLASPTLAQLYLSQGRLDSAQRVVDALLERDPVSGAALALRRRLADRRELACALERVARDGAAGDRLVVWTTGNADGAHVLLTTYALDVRGNATPRVTSRPVPTDASATHAVEFDAPPGPAAAVACVASLEQGRVRVHAVARAVSW